MRRIYIIYFCVLWSALTVRSQSFMIDPGKTMITNLDTMVMAHYNGFEIVNTGSVNLNLTWTLLLQDTLKDCEFDLCNSGNCFNTLPLSGTLPVITPGAMRFLFFHTFTGRTYGTNKLKYLLQNGSLQSDTLTYIVNVTNASSIKEYNAGNSITFFPNPTTGILEFDNSGNEIVKLTVYDISGKEVKKLKANEGRTVVDLSSFPNGEYIIRAIGSTGTSHIQKIIKKD